MKVLFWNTHQNKDINPILYEIIVENDISLVILAEYDAQADDLIESLARRGVVMWKYITTGCDRISIWGNISRVEPGMQSQYASIQVINDKDIFCCVHLPSKIFSQNEGMRNIAISQIISDICSIEEEMNTENTIVVGDFNIDPFEAGCINADLLHSIPVYIETQKKSRIIAGQEFRMFYNPMWNFLGDFNSPFGTYYFGGSNVDNTFWHLYDQVILRPALRERFIDNSLRILTETKSKSLLNSKGHPDKCISDHLPIVFEIREDYHE